MKYDVLLHKNPSFFTNAGSDTENADDFEFFGTVEAANANDAYDRTQNLDGLWNTAKPCRSVSVGDLLIQSGDGDVKVLRVEFIGFKEVRLVCRHTKEA